LGIAPRFAVDLEALSQRHRDLSKALHPDRHAGGSAASRRMALGRAIEVNDAFRVVRDPVRRAEALLRRAGVPVGETAEPKASPALLMEMMEAREELQAAQAKRDAARIARLADEMRGREGKTLRALGELLDGGRATEALPILGELRYVRRFLDEVSAIEEELATT
jgi:molecular chaperone HscB